MVIDISKMNLDNIDLYAKIGVHRKGQKLTVEEKIERLRVYNHQYYLSVTKEKRRLLRLLNKENKDE